MYRGLKTDFVVVVLVAVKVNYSKQAMNLNFPPKLNLKLSITEKRYKTLLLERNVAN